LPAAVGLVQEAADQVDQVAVAEAGHDVAEEEQGGQDGHHPWIPEAERRGMEAVSGGGRPGHLSQGDHVGSWPGILGLDVAETSVGALANTAECPPVVRVSVRSARPSLLSRIRDNKDYADRLVMPNGRTARVRRAVVSAA